MPLCLKKENGYSHKPAINSLSLQEISILCHLNL